jgi:hypothetical protein
MHTVQPPHFTAQQQPLPPLHAPPLDQTAQVPPLSKQLPANVNGPPLQATQPQISLNQPLPPRIMLQVFYFVKLNF